MSSRIWAERHLLGAAAALTQKTQNRAPHGRNKLRFEKIDRPLKRTI
jgi:hypothetical protein